MLDFLTFISQQWLLVSLLLLFIYAFVWRESKKGGTAVSSHQLTRMVNADEALLVDIRDAKEFSAGHIAGATNIPYAKLQSRISELSAHQDKSIILIDKFGQQTGAAGKELTKAGYQPARLRGGMADWQANNLPVVRKD
jgi:rhodanese-related sulfurtransferase